jgi:predicted SAM-dependent methyltransferase
MAVVEKVNNAKKEFGKYMKKWVVKDNRFMNGIDVGCGTDRIDDMVPGIDRQPEYRYASAQWVWDCKDLELFNDNSLDFIFSSHCLEDFSDIDTVFCNWWKKLKPNGLMLLLLPDMQAGRYPKCGEPRGNPSHRTNVGKEFMQGMLKRLHEKGKLTCEILQEDTIPHTETCSIDYVIKKVR